MKAFWVLTRQRLHDVLRSRSSASFVLLFPVLLLLVVGLVFKNGHPFEERHVAWVGDVDPSALAAFEEVHLDSARDHREAMGKLEARMVSAVLERDEEGLLLTVGARERLFGRGVVETLGEGARLSVVDIPSWGYVHYLFAGLLAFSIVVSGLFATGYTMSLYRQNRFLKKLATTPLPKVTFLGAVVAARGVLIGVQVVLMVLAGVFVFGLRFDGPALLWLAAIATLGTLTFMGAGFALTCAIKSEELITDVINAINMPLVFLSEIFFPLDALPRPLAWVGEILPSTQMVRLMRSVLLYGVSDPAPLFGGIALLAGWTVVTFAVSLWLFSWRD